MSTPRQRTGPTVPRMLLGWRLRQLRDGAGLTRRQAAEVIRSSESKISRVERGQAGRQDRDVTDLIDHYGLTDPDRRQALLALAQASRKRRLGDDLLPTWLAAHMDLEAVASSIRTYELQFIPGLLQIPSYARAVITGGNPGASSADIERRVVLRMERAQLLTLPDSLRLWAVIDEAALRRTIGGPAVMRSQLDHLLQAALLPSITLQVMPATTSGHAAEGGAFSLLRFPHPELPDIVYIEHLTRGFHIDAPAEVEVYVRAADNLAVQAAPPNDSMRIIAGIRDEIHP